MTERGRSPMRTVFSSPFLRSAFLALFLAGIGVSATTPQMTLYLVNDLHASVPVAGLYYLVSVLAPVAGYWLGSLSDRQPDRLRLYRICALVGGAGWLAMALATQVWQPFVIGATALSISGGSMGQLFAAARDHLTSTGTPNADRLIATLRMAFTAGWIIGPVLGSWFGAQFGLRPLLIGAALLTAGQILPLGRLRVPRYTGPIEPADDRDVASVLPTAAPNRRPLFVFIGCCVLLMAGDTIKFAFLPLYMANELHVSDTVRGAVIAVQPLLEFALMPVFAWLAQRTSAIRVLSLGGVFGVLANIAYATSHGVLGLFAGQLLMSGLWAALAGLGVTVAQQLHPQGIGMASSVFMGAIGFAGGLGGALGGVGTALFGLPHVFFVPAAFALLGTVGVALTGRRYRPSDRAFSAVAADVGG